MLVSWKPSHWLWMYQGWEILFRLEGIKITKSQWINLQLLVVTIIWTMAFSKRMEQREANTIPWGIDNIPHNYNNTLDCGKIQPWCIHPNELPLWEDRGYYNKAYCNVSERWHVKKYLFYVKWSGILTKSLILFAERGSLAVQWMWSLIIPNNIMFISRQIYIILFPECYPNCPWQIAIIVALHGGIYLYICCKQYLSEYVQLTSLEWNII